MEHIDTLTASIQNENLDAILITNPINRRYITGFTGTAGVVLITKNNERIFITDFRYVEQATEQAKGFTIVEHKKAIEIEIQNQIGKHHIKTLGFEKNDLTYATFKLYQKAFKVDLIPVNGLVEQLRLIKTADELDIMKIAAEIADAAYTHIQTFIKPGVREIDVAHELEFFMRKQGATSSSFDMIVASGYRSALPHGVASEKEIQTGELVTLDYGALYKGYCSDTTRTLAIGDISNELTDIYETVLEAQKRGVAGIKPGMTGKEADTLTRNYISDKGYGDYFGHSTGHGLGMEVHEEPRVSPLSDTVLKPGMVVTVEPGIYIPNVGGCRIEDDIVITETGNRRLTHATKELIHL